MTTFDRPESSQWAPVRPSAGIKCERGMCEKNNMVVSGEDCYCHQFHPNTFDPSRCGSCLRPGHMHSSVTAGAALQSDDDEDEDALSAITSNATRSGWTYEWTLVRSLSPDWELNIYDADTQSSSQNQWDCLERCNSLSPESHCLAQPNMTRLDPSPHRASTTAADSSLMDEWRGSGRSRRPSVSGSRADREQESGYFSPDRRGDGGRQMEEANKRPYRYYERGHPLPSNHSPEPKSCVPFRTVNLGVPSQRRSTETFLQEAWRSESPQRYTYHSNFRRGTESQENSPTRHYSISPDRYRLTESPPASKRRSSHCSSQTQSNLPSCGPSRALSHAPSGRSSPSRRRGSTVSRTVSPSRVIPASRCSGSSYLQKEEVEQDQRGRSRESRRPSQASNSHRLDSERLHRNLESISRRGSSTIQPISYEQSLQVSPQTRTNVNSSANTHTRNSRAGSPFRSGQGTHSHTPQREPCSRDSRPDTTQSYSNRSGERQDRLNICPPQGSFGASTPPFCSPEPSRGSSPPRRGVDSHLLAHSLKSHAETMETDKGNEGGGKASRDRSRSKTKRGLEALLTSELKEPLVKVEEVGMTIDDYIILADIPRVHLESEEELTAFRKRTQSPSPRRDQRLRTSSYQAEKNTYYPRAELEERGRGRERGRDRWDKQWEQEDGGLSQQPSSTSLHSQSSDNHTAKRRSSKAKQRGLSEPAQMQLDHCHLKGWMSKLDLDGKWRKHWFVLSDALLKYYRDSEAEESDDLDGEIDLMYCVNVSDCEVEKNYCFQIYTKRAVFTLSAVTSRVRRNWVKLLKQAMQCNQHQSDASSEKESPLSQRLSPCQPCAPLIYKDSADETTPADTNYNRLAADSHQADHYKTEPVDRDLEVIPSELSPASQRESGEGWDREQAKRLVERNKWFEEGITFGEMSSRWDSMELKKGCVPVPLTIDLAVNRKWSEFERLSFRDMSAQSLIGTRTYPSSDQEKTQPHISSQTYLTISEEALGSSYQPHKATSKEVPPSVNGGQTIQSSTAEALQREAHSLRQQVESIKRERIAMGMEVDSPCGPGAPCRARLEAMEAAHRKSLQELQEKHTREMRELELKRDRLLQEESQAAARAIEALKKGHKEEVERTRMLAEGGLHVETPYRGQVPQAESLHSELDVLSDHYSQKCSELSRTEQSSRDREMELGRKEREMEQLRRENQDLKTRLAEEISRMRHFITGQSSEVISHGNTDRTPSELEMLLRVKENEVDYLQKEISCLQSEVQSLSKEKETAYERYKEAYVELSGMKNRSQLEMGSLKEHLRLANAALQEGT